MARQHLHQQYRGARLVIENHLPDLFKGNLTGQDHRPHPADSSDTVIAHDLIRGKIIERPHRDQSGIGLTIHQLEGRLRRNVQVKLHPFA